MDCRKLSKNRVVAGATVLLLGTSVLCGCTESAKKPEMINLSVWCAEEEMEMVREMVNKFAENYSEEAAFNVTISPEGELSCKQTVLSNPQGAADVYTFAADQFRDLYNGGALLEITENTEEIIAANGGADSGAIQAVSVDDKLYAYPMTAGNGYFLYYNSDYFTEEDVKSLDTMLDIAAENGKKITIDYSNGWYVYSFFKGAGLNVGLNDDGVSNYCDWNSTVGKYTGVDVAEAMLDIATHEGFISCGDDDFVNGAKDGTIIAGVNGLWNSTDIQKAYGEGYAATKLPEYTVAGDSVQMCSFVGYKLVGVSAYSENPDWAMKLADWLTNEENQLERFRQRGECPSNVNAANRDEVKASPAIAAESEQSVYGTIADLAEQFWSPSYRFGATIAAGNIDNVDLQTLLDTMVDGITAPAVLTAETGNAAE